MAKKKMTIPDFKKFKAEGRKFAYTTAYDYTMATIVDESEVEIILVGDSLAMCILGRNSTVGVTMDDMIHHIKPVVLGAPNTFVVGDMPFGSYNQSPEQAIANASRMLMETGCDAIKLEGGATMAPTIRRLVDAGVPVMGHIGLTPQTASSMGGFKVQGGTPESAAELLRAAKAIEEAGAFSLVVECVPNSVGKALVEALTIPVLGIGAILGIGNALGKIDYNIIWRYFSWTNQTLAMIVLWAASMFLFYEKKNYWITAVPATFMTAVSITYFMLGNECLGQFLNKDGYNTALAYPVGILFAALFLGIFLYSIKKRDVKPQYETLGK